MQHVCHRSEPPGDEIYRYGNLSIYEVCGLANKSYCQCLCLLAKLFLDHKTLTYETDLFLFYILCLVNEDGANILGFFSKERGSANNLACIVVFPPYQRQGYGSLLIQLSYELSRREGVIAGPEYPLSDLGKTSYRKYWINVVCRLIQENCYEAMGISELSFKSGFRPSDIIAAVRAATLKDPHLIQLIRESDQEYVEIERNSFIGKPTRLLLRYEKLLWEPKDIYRTRHVSGVSRSHY
ncbi:hypothetical protein L596_029844 [Steinernema carpocapsae]|uniref:Histone acetyltransferase n=1 Tax=Steinernema carpocapsae TaxID=34508 RepID=A0A4U5LQZ7_STECR|nr:hypothetical protein L596_029844 [Steinernema carpocapsae]